MSSSIAVLKRIEHFSHENLLNSVKVAAHDTNMYCIYINTYFDCGGNFTSLNGTLSEVNEELLISRVNKGIETKRFTFNIHKPEETSFDSFTWLINKKDYYWAFDIEDASGGYEFLFGFFAQYFRTSTEDYLWFDDAKWYYSAQDIIRLSKLPYNPDWCGKKLV